MTDRTLCPSCNREFELPKRFMVKFEDYDYSPIPRLLSCLHTVCHSCLEDQRDRSPINQIICPICKADEIIKSVRHLPLDITSLKEVIRNRNDEIVASCSRCYDSTPSFSWCKSCSSALCEFHHQDHLLSAETSKHSIYTFKEIFHRNMPISYQLPPIACPETLLKDCSIFCHNCLHLISSQAMVENHKDHEVENYLDTIEPMETAVKEAVSLSKEKYNQLDVQINSLQECLAKLDDSEEQILSDIGRTFSILQKKLKERENALLEKVNQIIEGKKRKVMKDIRKLKEIQDDCENALEVGESLLEDSKGNSIDQMYLVNAASGVEYRADTIAESVDETMKTIKPVDPIVKIDFLRDEVQSIKSIVLSLGGLAYIDDYSVEKSSSLRTDISADPTAEADSKTEDESKNSLVDNSKQVEEKDKTLDQPKIYFCVHVQ